MKYVLPIFFFFAFVACAKERSDIDGFCFEQPPTDNRSKEDVLVIGDSISLGYTPTVRRALPEYEVTHNPCNGQSTRNALYNMDRWLSFRSHYKIITFNHGIWDILYNVSAEQYKANLRAIVSRLRTKTDKLIFVTTTHLPVNSDVSLREPGVEKRYNQAAIEVMQELNVTVFDLNAISNTMPEHLEEGAEGSNPHWDGYASGVFGNALADAIRIELAK